MTSTATASAFTSSAFTASAAIAEGTGPADTAAAPALSRPEQEELIRANIPLVGHLVRDMLSRVPNHIHRDDLTSAGLHALVTASRSYDPSRGIPFARFATTRIRGGILDELRSLDWATRSVRHKARTTDTTRQELTTSLGRTPTNTELAQALGTTTTDLHSTTNDVQRATVLSLQGFTTGTSDDMVTEPTPGPEDQLLRREQIGYLHHAIAALPERLRTVITTYYLHERPMAEIAAEFGVTESRISQLRAEALTLLKDGLNTHLDPDLASACDNPEGVIARRRASYYANIEANTTMHTRLAMTNEHGHTAHATAGAV
jgi:RNA polymerase sigma factor for flagellar operon FliA